jgi:hypothetical protein
MRRLSKKIVKQLGLGYLLPQAMPQPEPELKSDDDEDRPSVHVPYGRHVVIRNGEFVDDK